ncbi:hypothetical protein BC828DRAFT_275005 [Blastocladiella britannica]|nr:hypothetical protein BC828DRAFT_275005 [Blastocladiella britannica]
MAAPKSRGSSSPNPHNTCNTFPTSQAVSDSATSSSNARATNAPYSRWTTQNDAWSRRVAATHPVITLHGLCRAVWYASSVCSAVLEGAARWPLVLADEGRPLPPGAAVPWEAAAAAAAVALANRAECDPSRPPAPPCDAGADENGIPDVIVDERAAAVAAAAAAAIECLNGFPPTPSRDKSWCTNASTATACAEQSSATASPLSGTGLAALSGRPPAHGTTSRLASPSLFGYK